MEPIKDKNGILSLVHQYVIRNFGLKGYETVYTSTGNDIEESLLPYILPKSSVEKGEAYYFKYPLNSNVTMVKLVVGDGTDNFGRNKGKIIILVIPNSIYEENGGLLYYANPIWKKTIPLENDEPLLFNHFQKVDWNSNLKFIKLNLHLITVLIQTLFMYKHLIITIKNYEEDKESLMFLYKILAYVDNCIPEFFRNKISIKTLSSKGKYGSANCTILPYETVKSLKLNKDEYIFNYSKKYKEILGDTKLILLFKNLVQVTSKEKRDEFGDLICNYKKIVKENLIPSNLYKLIIDRFEIKVSKTWMASTNGFLNIKHKKN